MKILCLFFVSTLHCVCIFYRPINNKGYLMRGKNLVKLLKAIDLLSCQNGTSISEIGQNLEIDRRSVYRLIRMIEDLGFPLYNEKVPFEKEKRWKLGESFLAKLPNMNIPNVQLTIIETFSLYLLKSQITFFKGTELEKHITSAFGKLSLFFSKEATEKFEKIRVLFVSTSKFLKDYSGRENIIEQLMQATLSQETCYVTYHAFHDDQIKKFKIDPLHFIENDGGLYMFVQTSSFKDIRMLAVERIQEIQETGIPFDYPEDFDPESMLASAFDLTFDDPIQVKIWFSPDQARYIKQRQWSKTQKIKEQADGSILLSMETSGVRDVKKWVLSFGKEAKVIWPESLKKEILADLIAAKKHYMTE
jgi:predicted DNA-binding transcriptional regulator YafY